MDFTLVYITCPNLNIAHELARGSVQSRLAACANIIPGMSSIYKWEGVLQTDQETILILKTRSSLVESLTEWVTANHPYTIPCILQIPLLGGNESYIRWLKEQTNDRNDE
jgi:periplasmic divalent cation tolerance protein